ncbi:MAG: hypothetical protein JKY92_05485 [Magnetovibrio sp.]|nr:hypothetical protein [Magnetovibrio sp.]
MTEAQSQSKLIEMRPYRFSRLLLEPSPKRKIAQAVSGLLWLTKIKNMVAIARQFTAGLDTV